MVIFLKAVAPGQWRTASAAAVDGAALAGLQRYDVAEKLLLTSYKVLNNDRGVLKFYTTSSSRWLAKLYLAMGQPKKAAEYVVRR